MGTAARTTFLTARAAARHMIPRRSGVILAFGSPGDRSGPLRDYYLGGTQVAFDAIETIRRGIAAPGDSTPSKGAAGQWAGRSPRQATRR